MENKGSFSDLYDVQLKAICPMKIGQRQIEKGEIITVFDKIQVAGLSDYHRYITAHGGYGDKNLVYWEQTKEISLTFAQGVFNSLMFSIMCNAHLLEVQLDDVIEVTNLEKLETNEAGVVELKEIPIKDLFVYDINGIKVKDFTIVEKTLTIGEPYKEIVVSYIYNYINGGSCQKFGMPLITGFVELQGRTRVKDDETGQVVTGIIKIPKLKLLSNFSIRLGRQSDPVVGKFNAVGLPVGSRGNTYVCEFNVLNNDIDSDI